MRSNTHNVNNTTINILRNYTLSASTIALCLHCISLLSYSSDNSSIPANVLIRGCFCRNAVDRVWTSCSLDAGALFLFLLFLSSPLQSASVFWLPSPLFFRGNSASCRSSPLSSWLTTTALWSQYPVVLVRSSRVIPSHLPNPREAISGALVRLASPANSRWVFGWIANGLKARNIEADSVKCSGIPPCQNCLKNRIECTVDRNNDKRRKSGIKNKLERLEDRKDLLLSLIRTIRDSGNRRTLQLLDLVRSNASLAEIKFYLDESPAQPDLEKKRAGESNDAHDNIHLTRPSDSPSTETKDAFDSQHLADIPLFDVPANPWTTVVQDAGLVSQLVSLWFTWFHPFSNWLDRDLFIRDMRSGDCRASFCSPFLVNAMLAVACVSVWFPSARFVSG